MPLGPYSAGNFIIDSTCNMLEEKMSEILKSGHIGGEGERTSFEGRFSYSNCPFLYSSLKNSNYGTHCQSRRMHSEAGLSEELLGLPV